MFVDHIFLPRWKMSWAALIEQEAGQAVLVAGWTRGLRAPVVGGR